MRRDLERLGVDRRDIVLVLNVHPYVALAVAGRLLRRAAQVDCAHDGTVLGVDHRGIRRAVAEDPNARVKRIEHNAIRPALHIDRLDGRMSGILLSHITTGLLLPKPWCDLGSTATPRALALAISPTEASVSRSKTVIRASVAAGRGMYNRRPSTSA